MRAWRSPGRVLAALASAVTLASSALAQAGHRSRSALEARVDGAEGAARSSSLDPAPGAGAEASSPLVASLEAALAGDGPFVGSLTGGPGGDPEGLDLALALGALGPGAFSWLAGPLDRPLAGAVEGRAVAAMLGARLLTEPGSVAFGWASPQAGWRVAHASCEVLPARVRLEVELVPDPGAGRPFALWLLPTVEPVLLATLDLGGPTPRRLEYVGDPEGSGRWRPAQPAALTRAPDQPVPPELLGRMRRQYEVLPSPLQEEGVDLPVRVLARGPVAPHRRKGSRVVLRDEPSLLREWERLHAGRVPSARPPQVDSARELVLAIYRGLGEPAPVLTRVRQLAGGRVAVGLPGGSAGTAGPDEDEVGPPPAPLGARRPAAEGPAPVSEEGAAYMLVAFPADPGAQVGFHEDPGW